MPRGSGRVGQYGGDWRMLVYRAKDVRMMLIYGYARLVAFDRFYRLEPDLLRSFEVKDGRTFTFTLRRGHKWSDGAPFTSENFRYYWQSSWDNNRPDWMDKPNPEFPDDFKVRYWDAEWQAIVFGNAASYLQTTLEDQELEERPVVVDGHAPLLVVVGAVAAGLFRPGAALGHGPAPPPGLSARTSPPSTRSRR